MENYFEWNESEDDTVLVVDSVQKSSSSTTNNSTNDEENGEEKEKIVKYKSKSTVNPAKVGLHSRNRANEATKEREINESEESIADGKDFTPSSSSTQDDTEYHIRHCKRQSSMYFVIFLRTCFYGNLRETLNEIIAIFDRFVVIIIKTGNRFTCLLSNVLLNFQIFFYVAFLDSSAKFFCIVYFAEQFRKIRKALFPDGEERLAAWVELKSIFSGSCTC